MEIKNPEIYEESYKILKSVYGEDANFRDGQYEAIEATMTNRRTLVVQRTGWGKSLVYFMCTKMFRKRNQHILCHHFHNHVFRWTDNVIFVT